MAAMDAKPTLLQRRICIGAFICIAAYMVIGLRLAEVTLFAAPTEPARSNSGMLARADLVDRNGELLARDVRVYDLYANPANFTVKHRVTEHSTAAQQTAATAERNENATRVVKDLSAVTGMEEGKLAHMLAKRTNYVLIARQMPADVRSQIERKKLPGIEFIAAGKRNYPDGRMSAQVLGVTNSDGKGLSGLERGLEPRLVNAMPGTRIETSLDMRVQFVLAHEAEATKQEFSAKSAGALVMNVDTGEVLGMVSLPDFDPNDRRDMDGNAARNIMVQDTYELGSVFKVLSFALGIEDHTFQLDEVFPIDRNFSVSGHVIHEAERMPPTLAARDVLALSSNIGASQIALRSGGVRQKAFLEKFGLLTPLRTELPESARPQYPRNWGPTETATIGFGHGISVSPLAYAAAAAAVVNGGRKVTPTFLKHPQDARGEQILSPETSVTMRGLLRYVVTNGSGRKANVEGYDVGGKTGSAEKLDASGHYRAGLLRTSFVGVFPVSNPRYVVFVLVDEPHGTKAAPRALAGNTAAPLAGRIIARIAPFLGVPMKLPTATAASSRSSDAY